MENELVDLVMEDTRERMARAIEHVKSEFGAVRTGRASSVLVEGLLIDYYGTETPLKQLANFSVPEPRLLVVSPFDKGSMAAIEKAISNADLGLTPSNDGNVIRLGLPGAHRGASQVLRQDGQGEGRRGPRRPCAGCAATPVKSLRPSRRKRACPATRSSASRRCWTR